MLKSFFKIEFHCIFSYLIKYCHIMLIIVVSWLGSDRSSGHLFVVAALFLSILTPLFLPSSISLSYFILDVLMRECLGKHPCMSSTFPVAISTGTLFFPKVQLQVHMCVFRVKKSKYLSISKPIPLNWTRTRCRLVRGSIMSPYIAIDLQFKLNKINT